MHAVVATLVVLVSQAGDGGCEPESGSGLAGACRVDTSGIRVEDGAVVDVLTVSCDPKPARHEIKGWLEHRRSPEQDYAQLAAAPWVNTVPDAEGFEVRIASSPCKAGQWRAVWRAKGVGPTPPGHSFDVTDSDYWPTTVTKEDCWGWS